MLGKKVGLIKKSVSTKSGAQIAVVAKKFNNREGIELWFSELDKTRGPIIQLYPTGTMRHKVELRFGAFASAIIKQIKNANDESQQLARLLISQIDHEYGVTFPNKMRSEDWTIDNVHFTLKVERKKVENYFADSAIINTCEEIIVPLIGALAELIGYEEISENLSDHESMAKEGAIYFSTVIRRERNPRNRMLCLKVHGDRCGVCGFISIEKYPSLGSVIEIHHIEQLSELDRPKVYDPLEDLIPLCPNCHRAIHKERPPLPPSKLRELLNGR